MSSSVLYFNAKKDRKMAATLSKRLKKAWKLAPCLRTKLDEMLKERNDYNFAVNTNGQLFKNGNEVDKKQVFNTQHLIKEQENTNI